MMSKPVSRTSFVMSKIVAHSFGFLITLCSSRRSSSPSFWRDSSRG
jgi:hypothetical protein